MRIEPAISAYRLTRAKKHGAGPGSRLQAFKMALAMFCCANGCTPWYARLAWWVAIHGTPNLPHADRQSDEGTPMTTNTEKAINRAREKAEDAVTKILIGLQNDTGLDLDHINVDTRNFANCKCEIFFQARR